MILTRYVCQDGQLGRILSCLTARNQAYKLCSEKDLVPEMVYLLGKIGNNKKALNLIIERLDDVKGVSPPSSPFLLAASNV